MGVLISTARPSRDDVLMKQAQIVAERSTCIRAQVGVVIAHDSRVVSQGYNGAPAKMPHCDHTCTCSNEFVEATDLSPPFSLSLDHDLKCPHRLPCTISVHAEANAIAFAAKHGVATAGAHLYTTLGPCVPCAQLIINAGIMRVAYLTAYRDRKGIDLLRTAGVGVSSWFASGSVGSIKV